jgi:hypothetical protein
MNSCSLADQDVFLQVTLHHGPGFVNMKLKHDKRDQPGTFTERKVWRPNVAFYPHPVHTVATLPAILRRLGTTLEAGLCHSVYFSPHLG